MPNEAVSHPGTKTLLCVFCIRQAIYSQKEKGCRAVRRRLCPAKRTQFAFRNFALPCALPSELGIQHLHVALWRYALDFLKGADKIVHV